MCIEWYIFVLCMLGDGFMLELYFLFIARGFVFDPSLFQEKVINGIYDFYKYVQRPEYCIYMFIKKG
jgi:hypothetical protein